MPAEAAPAKWSRPLPPVRPDPMILLEPAINGLGQGGVTLKPLT
jgi:hypothetical protein